jgi:hypothetical protein
MRQNTAARLLNWRLLGVAIKAWPAGLVQAAPVILL